MLIIRYASPLLDRVQIVAGENSHGVPPRVVLDPAQGYTHIDLGKPTAMTEWPPPLEVIALHNEDDLYEALYNSKQRIEIHEVLPPGSPITKGILAHNYF